MDLLLPWCLQDVRIWDVRSLFKAVFSTCILAYSMDKARILVISPGALSLSLSMLLGIPGGVRLISLLPLLNGTFLWGDFLIFRACGAFCSVFLHQQILTSNP